MMMKISNEVCLVSALKFFNSKVACNESVRLMQGVCDQLIKDLPMEECERSIQRFEFLWNSCLENSSEETCKTLARNFLEANKFQINRMEWMCDSLRKVFSSLTMEKVEEGDFPSFAYNHGRMTMWFVFLRKVMNQTLHKDFVILCNNVIMIEKVLEERSVRNFTNDFASEDSGMFERFLDFVAFIGTPLLIVKLLFG